MKSVFLTMIKLPIQRSYKWIPPSTEDSNLNLSKVFVHTMDFPDSSLWIWIGESSGDLSNLSLAMNCNKKRTEIVSTSILQSQSDELVSKSKLLASRLSKLLHGRPVFFSYSMSESGICNDLLGLPDLEIELFKLLKSSSIKG